LTASDSLLQQRLYTVSGFEQAPDQEKALIEKFIGRAQRYNERMMQALRLLDLPWVNVEEASSLENLVDTSLCLLGTGT